MQGSIDEVGGSQYIIFYSNEDNIKVFIQIL
jgi:hypothetical protein